MFHRDLALKIMVASTPSGIEPKPTIKDGELNIAVAIVSLVERFNGFSATLLRDSILAGIRRAPVEIISHGDSFLNCFAVVNVVVAVGAKAEALEAIRSTLRELYLLESATIAIYTADNIWLILQGFNKGTTDFEALFIRPEYLEQARENIRAMEKRRPDKTAALLREICNLLAKGTSKTDSQ